MDLLPTDDRAGLQPYRSLGQANGAIAANATLKPSAASRRSCWGRGAAADHAENAIGFARRRRPSKSRRRRPSRRRSKLIEGRRLSARIPSSSGQASPHLPGLKPLVVAATACLLGLLETECAFPEIPVSERLFEVLIGEPLFRVCPSLPSRELPWTLPAPQTESSRIVFFVMVISLLLLGPIWGPPSSADRRLPPACTPPVLHLIELRRPGRGRWRAAAIY